MTEIFGELLIDLPAFFGFFHRRGCFDHCFYRCLHECDPAQRDRAHKRKFDRGGTRVFGQPDWICPASRQRNDKFRDDPRNDCLGHCRVDCPNRRLSAGALTNARNFKTHYRKRNSGWYMAWRCVTCGRYPERSKHDHLKGDACYGSFEHVQVWSSRCRRTGPHCLRGVKRRSVGV